MASSGFECVRVRVCGVGDSACSLSESFIVWPRCKCDATIILYPPTLQVKFLLDTCISSTRHEIQEALGCTPFHLAQQ